MDDQLRISPTDARRMLDAGQAIVLDVVAPGVWEALEDALPGAVRIPPEQVGARFGELPRDRAIVAYCT